ncbi:DUF885 domain-containing protein [Actinophytocola oryzae]|uniref:Uncharacterized protein (DUF885 family) n=1 Tax=Actinophytocola oryzae TaxID=502181 RepID=A0A4V3FQN7_9PSEU|nr:DUF885 domain-containing protein [Actinophytocola oryzae]TDV40381.1 uncharacterized protein (DUF885 family) [Actinophytocola oryzae]
MTVHRIADSFVDQYVELSPTVATALGVPGYDDRLPDLSPDGCAARNELARKALADMAAAEPADDRERVAKAVFTERLGVDVELYDAGLVEGDLNVLASPPQDLRETFDLMPAETAEHWATIATRLSRMPEAVAGYQAGLSHAAARGHVAARRQVEKVATQCARWSDGFFTEFAAGGPDSLRAELDAGAAAASQAYADLAEFLRTELLPKAPAKDAVGEDAYRLHSRHYLGAALDLREAYEWGWTEFLRLEAEMKEIANRIRPGASLVEAAEVLDADPRYQVRGVAEFRDWMQKLSDQALTDLRGVHFDIPDPIMRLDCRIAPPGGSAGAYYTNPSDDFSRPGAMWWALPPDKAAFTTWRELSTVYHEGVPGHHMQIATAMYEAERLNKFQRMLAWVPAYSEGWALYAERLMREFGYLTDDGNLYGMLNENLFRAARVIIDIGMHLELGIPAGTGFHEGERWTPELGLEFMLTRTITERELVVDEVDRYLGWPGQAPAYKLGERLWLAARDEARARKGAAFDLKAFHMEALYLGQMGLDTLRECLAAI